MPAPLNDSIFVGPFNTSPSSSLLSKNLKSKIYRTVIFPAVLYGCDTLSLTLREKSRLRVLENRVLR
jgi:hypothetical protein